jgi:glycosyltransferase involved in cell wall biosynthesis
MNVSIVIITHDIMAGSRPEWMRQAVQSALVQRGVDEPGGPEIVVVDGGSTDGTQDFLKTLRGVDKVVEMPVPSIPAQRRAGVDAAAGRNILFLDSDDWMASMRTCETLLRVMHADRSYRMVYGMCQDVAADGTVLGVDPRGQQPYIQGSFVTANQALHPVMFDRAAYLEIGGHDSAYPYASDYDLALHMEEKFGVARYGGVLYNYRQWGGSVSALHAAEQKVFAEQAVAAAKVRRGSK